MRQKFYGFAAVGWCLVATWPIGAYVDLAPTLPRIIRESQTIVVAEVVRYNSEKGAVVLKKVRDLKGQSGSDPIKHQLVRAGDTAVDWPLLEWAEPGRRCVLFISGKAAVVCVGEAWYETHLAEGDWWRIGVTRPELPLAYYGAVSRLVDAVPVILAGKTAMITTLPHGADKEGASFDLALNRASQPGLVKLQRLRANKNMPEMAFAVGLNSGFVAGFGRVGQDELPALRTKLKSPDAVLRAESAMDLGFVGPDAADVAGDLAKLLDDEALGVRLAAATALLRIKAKDAALAEARAIAVLTQGLSAEDAASRRHAARAAGLAGPAAAPLAEKLGALLNDPDMRVRRTALQALAGLGSASAKQLQPVMALLDNRETAMDAADALGRMGTAARPALKGLGRLLSAEAPAERWAAVRAMAQIGGDEAAPAVKFIIKELPKASEIDGYNMMIFLSLLGPVAKDAIPVVYRSRVRNPILKQATVWAINPGAESFVASPFGDAEFFHYIMEAYVRELGDHLKPAAQVLARKIVAGKAGNVPPWGYKLLARFPDESLTVLTPALANKQLVIRERATVAIGFMGRVAHSARPQVAQALKASQDEREQRLLQWCLRELQ